MIKPIQYILAIILLTFNFSYGQLGSIEGTVRVDNNLQEYATIFLAGQSSLGGATDSKGNYKINDIPYGKYTVTASFIGYQEVSKTIIIAENTSHKQLSFDINESINTLDAIVVTGTKTFQRQTNSPVIVNVINSKTIEDVQACNLSEGLKFQPGLRVETDCQTCNYTQLRMNGLAGGYSQILINGRPIFSPLTGLYGLEQIPANMIERIEVVRGGGSSLYGSSAIGGTVNIISKIPQKNSYELHSFYQNINGKSNDIVFSGNNSLISDDKSAGVSFFFNHREREYYDHNGDNYSEIPLLENTSLGTNMFFLPTDNQKLEINISNINEFRYGGEMVSKPAYLTLQSEERTHNVWMGSVDYQINFNDDNSSFIAYVAGQNTKRKHYTGIFPDDSLAIQDHLELPPYGTSNTTTYQGGIQLNHKIYNFIKGTNTLTFGTELVVDDVFDEIATYNYEIDQTTKDFGAFIQSDWKILPSLVLLSGVRMDKHNLVDKLIFSPRASLLYKYKNLTQFRANYGTGFRAPQAFDTDLHIAFAGGGVSRILLSPDLIPEDSKTYGLSVNYDKPRDHYIMGYTVETFYTKLINAYYLEPIGSDNFGELFEKRNGQTAIVKGVTMEVRANYDKKIQIEAGLTFQSSEFDKEITYIDELEGLTSFIRTPNEYGFATLSFTPNDKFSINMNYLYTGKMKIPHFAGAPNQLVDEIITSKPFSELSLKVVYEITIENKSRIEFYSGVKNVLNEYQSAFDIGKNRDSNFVYGPSLPRTFYFGMKLKSL